MSEGYGLVAAGASRHPAEGSLSGTPASSGDDHELQQSITPTAAARRAVCLGAGKRG
ncbi:MAG: hypothetical protein ACYC8T_31695 [Myxococcaceae bacterium]